MPPIRRRLVAGVLIAIFVAASIVSAQQIWIGGGFYGREAPRIATQGSFDGSFNFCRGFFTSTRREYGGQGWWTDYPGADNNFSVRIAELTKVRVKLRADGQPDHVVIPLDDPLLFRCPILLMEDVGTLRFKPEEIDGLREYLLKGGFLWVDDFWGSRAWDVWLRELSKVLPPEHYPVTDIPMTHPIMHTLYDVKRIPQVSSISHWYRSGGEVSERGSDSIPVNFKGVQDARGRLMIVMTHNTDIADTWEREGENQEYFTRFSPEGYAVGVNIFLYAMTH
jgi:hypothetical protein